MWSHSASSLQRGVVQSPLALTFALPQTWQNYRWEPWKFRVLKQHRPKYSPIFIPLWIWLKNKKKRFNLTILIHELFHQLQDYSTLGTLACIPGEKKKLVSNKHFLRANDVTQFAHLFDAIVTKFTPFKFIPCVKLIGPLTLQVMGVFTLLNFVLCVSAWFCKHFIVKTKNVWTVVSMHGTQPSANLSPSPSVLSAGANN